MLISFLQRISSKISKNELRNTKYFTTTLAQLQNEDQQITPSTVLVEKDTHITLIGLNREETRNSIDNVTAERLSEAFQKFEDDETSPVAVLYGIGGSFSAGYDTNELERQAEQGSFDFLMRAEGGVGPTRRHLRKPVICAMNGFCVANGLELALLCDLRVMEDSAVLGFFNRRLGVPIIDGGTVRLAKLIGISRALDLIATGRRVSGQEAFKIGLVNRLVATGTALGQAVNLAFSIGKFSMAALNHDRNSVYSSAFGNRGFRINTQNEIMLQSPEIFKEIKDGIKQFKEYKLSSGKFRPWNIKEKFIPEWEKKEIAHEEAHEKTQNQQKNTSI